MFASSGLSKSLHDVTTQKTVIYKQEFATSTKVNGGMLANRTVTLFEF